MNTTVPFAFTGAAQSHTFDEAGVATVTLNGAGSSGIAGGRSVLTIPVLAGDVWQINVGGQPDSFTGGWNGGGQAASNTASYGGGGATDIRINGTTLADRYCVAGGAGGLYSNSTYIGGQGGGTSGGDGAAPGHGGTQSAGGAGYDGASPGAPGTGGGGGVSYAGGGGGYYGGGGGAGGGGGSGYLATTVPAGATSGGTTTQGTGNLGNGDATIVFTPPPILFTGWGVPL